MKKSFSSAPRTLVVDNGTAYRSAAFIELVRRLGVDAVSPSPFSARAKGLLEKVYQAEADRKKD